MIADQELIDFNVTEAAIADLAAQYMPLTVDKEGLKVVNAARKVVKEYRIKVDKRRKELNADALEYQRRINGEARRITALLDPIENHLEREEKKVADEIERVKREKEQTETDRYQLRIKKLHELKFLFDGVKFHTSYLDTFNNEIIEVAVLHLKQWDDETFSKFFDNAKHYYDIDQKNIAERETRFAEERQALEVEKLRLSIIKEQTDKEIAIKETQQRREHEMEQERLADLAYIARKKADKERLKSKKPIIVISTSEEENAYRAGFKFAIECVMNTIKCEIEENPDSKYSEHAILVREAIESELEYLRNDS